MRRDRDRVGPPLLSLVVSLALLASTAVIGYEDVTQLAATYYRRPVGDWKMVFSDEFRGSELSTRRWTTCYWWDVDGCSNEGNNELQWYLPGQVAMSDGDAVLQARAEPVTLADGRVFPYRSGMITTGRDTSDLSAPPRFTFTYGHLEVRARLPAGRGLWPAIWLLPADHISRPEIDVMEMLGDSPWLLRMHVHYVDGDGNRASLGQNRQGPNLSRGFHTYGLTWTPTELIFWRDGIRQWRVTEPDAIPHEPMYLLINLAVGGDWPGPPARGSLPADMAVEYVRIWQKDPP